MRNDDSTLSLVSSNVTAKHLSPHVRSRHGKKWNWTGLLAIRHYTFRVSTSFWAAEWMKLYPQGIAESDLLKTRLYAEV